MMNFVYKGTLENNQNQGDLILCFIFFVSFLSYITSIFFFFPGPCLKIGKFIVKDICDHNLIFTVWAKSLDLQTQNSFRLLTPLIKKHLRKMR